MKKFFVLLGIVCSLFSVSHAAATLKLAENGQTSYVIALAADAIPAEKTAAQQLQKYLQEVTGANFTLQGETEVAAGAPQIVVGAGVRAKALLPRQGWASLGADGIVIQTIGNNLVLAGGRPRGTLYAVFQFLEETVGCRWWTPTENFVPRKTTLEIQPQNIVYVPPFNYREHFTIAVRENPEFATLLRENGHFQTQSNEWGGHYNMLGFVHTFSKLLPPEKYFKEHPEWYTDPANGFALCTPASKMPAPQKTELDLSNPLVLEEVTKNALAWIKENPAAGYISISQNDNRDAYCRCPQCAAVTAAEGSPSGPLLKFVNQVAERIYQQHPDFLVETLAYYYSEAPPKTIRPAKNVIIRLAPINSDYGHPLDSQWNQSTRDRIKAWAEIAPQLFIWNYVTNFRANALPHPNWDGLAKDLRFFAAHKVTGVFEQGDAYTNGVGDFVQLRTWLVSKLMWNPNLDQDKLMNEFLQGYYGAAAPYLRQYIDLVQESFRAQNRELNTFNPDLFFFSLNTMQRSMQLFDQAEQAVQGDEALTKRVKRTRLSLEFARLHQFQALRREAAATEQQVPGNNDARQAMQQWVEAARSYGVRNYKEGVPFATQVPLLLSMNVPPVELPEFAKTHRPEDVIDLQAGEFNLFKRGTESQLEADENAASGVAASIIGATNAWAIQADLNRFLKSNERGKWRINAMARVVTKPGIKPKGGAFQSGVYDLKNRVAISSKYVPWGNLAGSTYQRVDLGVVDLDGGMYIWFAPLNDPAVEKIYIERVILIREEN